MINVYRGTDSLGNQGSETLHSVWVILQLASCIVCCELGRSRLGLRSSGGRQYTYNRYMSETRWVYDWGTRDRFSPVGRVRRWQSSQHEVELNAATTVLKKRASRRSFTSPRIHGEQVGILDHALKHVLVWVRIFTMLGYARSYKRRLRL